MKKILIYGDSNVWGQTPTTIRLPREQRWTTILQDKLGKEYEVSTHGVPGRCAGGPFAKQLPQLNGPAFFDPIFRLQSPVDIVIIALGGNDLRKKYNRTPEEITKDIKWYEGKSGEVIKSLPSKKMPKFLYILPSGFGPKSKEEFIVKNRKLLNQLLKKQAENYVEAENVELSADDLHWAPEGHAKMAQRIYDKLKEMEGE